MSASEKVFIVATHGPEDAELATIPFVMAAAALASDVEVVMAFQANGVNLVRKGEAAHVLAPGFPPLAQLMADVQALGGQLLVCSPCLQSRELHAPEDLISGTEVIAGARFIAEATSATSTLSY